jgi:4'-phosphopantetheinyl transferase
MSQAASWPRPDAVEVFVAGIDRLRAPEGLEPALALMTADERVRASRYRHDDDRLMFALGRLMARSLVGRALGVGPSDWPWREGRHGRPEIDDDRTDLHFNLSHSAGVVICALARGRAIGVDVEHLARRTPDPAVVPRYCSPAEVEDVRSRGDAWQDRFLTYWTLKEAYLKARGVGISLPLSDISFRVDNGGAADIRFEGSLAGTDARWAFHLWQPDEMHLAAIAADMADGVRPAIAVHAF